ncbi:hypothetical protein ACIBF5_06605 [Micromonospora sp. NPDC050417]|uniref:hypothetical protein n=1 Tax=Micromonospora sp. NPDC050417 TaxID=3364280 RepID=UPI0037A012AB
MSEAAFVFPASSRSELVGALDGLASAQPDQWVAEGPLFVWLVDEVDGLYLDWEPEDVANLEQSMGCRPAWGVQIQYRMSRRQRMVTLVLALLRPGGVAVDDFCTHAWTAEEIETGVLVAGGRFGEPPVR